MTWKTNYYSVELAHVQVVINCLYSVAQMCTHEDTHAHILGMPYIDDVMSYNSLASLYKVAIQIPTVQHF